MGDCDEYDSPLGKISVVHCLAGHPMIARGTRSATRPAIHPPAGKTTVVSPTSVPSLEKTWMRISAGPSPGL